MLKETMTSFDIAAVVQEINATIRDTFIDNIYQINTLILVLNLRKPSQSPTKLLIEAGKRFHLTSYIISKPSKPPAFCMALRKYLKNGRIIEVRQHEFERIIIIKVKTKEGNLQLVCELFGEGNIILVNQQNRILHALSYKRMRDRNILRKEIFQYPPSSGRNPLKLIREELYEVRALGKLEIVRGLVQFLATGGLYSEEVLLRAGINKNTPCQLLTSQQLDGISNQLNNILSFVTTGKTEPCIIINEKDELIDVTPIRLKKYDIYKHKKYETFNEAIDEYYAETTLRKKEVSGSTELEQELGKLERILQNQHRTAEDLKKKNELNKKIGDIIYAHFGELKFLLQGIVDAKKGGKSWEQVMSDIKKDKQLGSSSATYFHSLQPKGLTLNVSLDNQTFALNLRRSIQDNAANYYTEAKKAEKKLDGANEAVQETLHKIEKLKQQWTFQMKETQKPLLKARKRAWYEKFRWFNSSESLLVIGGRDAVTNEILIKKYMESQDIVLHADIIGAPFVLIKTEGKTPTEQTLMESAQFAASYSRAWKETLGTIDVYWVKPEQVSKSPSSGQYIQRGAFIIRGTKNYIRNIPLQITIGIKTEEEYMKIIGGPVEAIAKQANAYVKIVPGKLTSSKLAKKLRVMLASKFPEFLQKRVLEIPLEEIQRFIPLGEGEIKS
jgi:predicted ribosome quality control (RQC) complex YloA/Tae2 family protein